MADFLNIHMAQLLIGVGAMLWIYAKYSGDTSNSDDNDDSNGSDSDDESVVSVAATVVEKYKHL